jgi:hypothetical protein
VKVCKTTMDKGLLAEKQTVHWVSQAVFAQSIGRARTVYVHSIFCQKSPIYRHSHTYTV